MDREINLKTILYLWLHYKTEDNVIRPVWIQKHCGEQKLNENGRLDDFIRNTNYNLYKNGEWKVE